jgi:hypothetical protein
MGLLTGVPYHFSSFIRQRLQKIPIKIFDLPPFLKISFLVDYSSAWLQCCRCPLDIIQRQNWWSADMISLLFSNISLLVHEYYNKDDCCVRVWDASKPVTTIQLIIRTVSESEMPPSQLPPSLRVEIVQGRNVFPSIICKKCDRFPTQHRCLVEVTTGGYLFDGLVVCGAAVCAICSAKCGQEGTFRCGMHAATSSERRATEPYEYATTFVTEGESATRSSSEYQK